MSAIDVRPVEVEHQPTPKREYGSTVLGAILVVVGLLWMFDAVDLIELRGAIVLAAALAVVGVALIAGAFDGPHSGLVAFGVFLTVAVVASAITPLDAWRGGIGERRHVVERQADLAPEYRLGMGDMRLDLSDLRLTETAVVSASVGAGTIWIELPSDLPVSIDATAGAGKVELFGETSEGMAVDREYESPGFAAADVTLTLDLDVSAGEIEVTR